MTHKELVEMLIEKGYDHGWVMTGGVLDLWEHEEDPPAPLTRLTKWILRLWWLSSLALSLYSLRSFINTPKKTVKITDGYTKRWAE